VSRIIGQCNTADFRTIDDLSLLMTLDKPEMLDSSTLKRKEKLALVVVVAVTSGGCKFSDIFNIKEVLFWEDGHWEFKFQNSDDAKKLCHKLKNPVTMSNMRRGVQNFFGLKGYYA